MNNAPQCCKKWMKLVSSHAWASDSSFGLERDRNFACFQCQKCGRYEEVEL